MIKQKKKVYKQNKISKIKINWKWKQQQQQQKSPLTHRKSLTYIQQNMKKTHTTTTTATKNEHTMEEIKMKMKYTLFFVKLSVFSEVSWLIYKLVKSGKTTQTHTHI